jgi:hypothetical protein
MISPSKAFAAIAGITFLTIPSLCFSQSDPANKETQIKSTKSASTSPGDTLKGTPDEKIVKSNSNPANKDDRIKSIDSTKYNIFGDLLHDDTAYNKKYPVWIPMVEVPVFNVGVWAFDRYISNADYARISTTTWSHNIKTGWEWDSDRFGMNFLLHPYSGGLNFTSALSNGYNFWQSLPFAIGGSLMWEYFGENTLPAYNDLINTPLSGAFYGEILYRLGSNLLDDRKTGTERFFRELGAAALSPTRFLNRLMQGKLTRVTTEEVYQKEPINVEVSAGMRKVNDGSAFWTGPQNALLAVQLDYGYPMEKREWKPFDYFKARAGINIGVGRKIVENITGYGILFGKNVQSGDVDMLFGAFQHYDYFDNSIFELGTIALGAGIMSKYPVFKESSIFTNFHLCFVPLAGNSTRLGPDTSQIRDYNYADGMETKLETGLNLAWASLQVTGYYYWIHTFVGTLGNDFIGIIRPRITVKLFRNINLGLEQSVFITDRFTPSLGSFHGVRTEQRIFFMLNAGNFKL